MAPAGAKLSRPPSVGQAGRSQFCHLPAGSQSIARSSCKRQLQGTHLLQSSDGVDQTNRDRMWVRQTFKAWCELPQLQSTSDRAVRMT